MSLLAPQTAAHLEQLQAVRRNAALKEAQALDLGLAMHKEELQIKHATRRFVGASPARSKASPNKSSFSPKFSSSASPIKGYDSRFQKGAVRPFQIVAQHAITVRPHHKSPVKASVFRRDVLIPEERRESSHSSSEDSEFDELTFDNL